MDAAIFDIDRLIALTAFAFLSTWTPGPNNIMLANSGASYGFRRTLPHALGVALGFSLMIFLIALGLGKLFEASPLFRETLRWGGIALLLYIGFKIATAPAVKRSAEDVDARGFGARPFTFFEAAGFQWINPKAWAMSIGVASTYLVGQAPLAEAVAAAGAFVVAGMTSSHSWAAFGAGLQRFLSTESRMRAFNVTMGILVAACVIFLFLDDL